MYVFMYFFFLYYFLFAFIFRIISNNIKTSPNISLGSVEVFAVKLKYSLVHNASHLLLSSGSPLLLLCKPAVRRDQDRND